MDIDFHRTCKYSFLDTAVGDVLRAIDGKSLMGSMILSFCIIDYMAQAISSNWSGTRTDFKRYVTEYMGDSNILYKSLGEEMYAVRNSLIHSYGESDSSRKLNLQFLFATRSFKNNHLQIKNVDNDSIIYFDLPSLVSEIVISILKFFEYNSTNEDLFEAWYSKKIKVFTFNIFHKVPQEQESTFPYSKIHTLLDYFSIHDYNNSESIANFADLIRKKCSS